MAEKALFIFLDESGNLDFSPQGSKYWSLTALCTTDPVAGRDVFTRLLYELAAEGDGIEYFHATEDRQVVRNRVFAAIRGLEEFELHSVIAEKAKAHPSLYRRTILRKGKKVNVNDETEFYKLVCRTLLRYVISGPQYQHIQSFVIVLSSLFDRQKHAQIEGGLKAALKSHTAKPFNIYFRQNKSDINCQLTDYCAWAIAISWERDEHRSVELIRDRIKSQFDLFGRGSTRFY